MKKITKLVLAVAVAASTIVPAKAVETNPFTSILGVVTGLPVGAIFGGARGSLSKGTEYADAFSDELGDGPLANIFGIPAGMFVGGIAGGLTGLVKGGIDGIKIGAESPFTNESYSVDGDVLSFDPYDFD